MQNLSVKVEGEQKELVIRTGEALREREPQQINITGNILAPGNWLDVRKAEKQRDHCKFSFNEMKIVFVKNETSGYATTITGELKLNPDLKKFQINSDKQWTTADLAKFLKMNRLFFADADQCAKIIAELNSLKAKIQTEIEQSQNNRGNSKSLVNTKVDSNVPLKFKLKMPVFIGFKEKVFIVEIGIETSDREIQLWLESAELNEIIIGERDKIITAEVEKFKKSEIPVIEY